MEGIFKGWRPDKQFGFITPDDGSPDVFLHQSKVMSVSLSAGCRVAFEAETTDKGRSAVSVSVLSQGERKRGRVKFWSERGYGFVEPSDGSDDAFLHANALPPGEEGYASDGLVVEFSPVAVKKGIDAGDVAVVGWTKPGDHLTAFADMGPPGWLQCLAEELAEKEPWEYSCTTASEPLPILRSYVRHTFRRLEETSGGVAISADGQSAAFNTGLVTPNQEELYAFFEPNTRTGRQRWRFVGFKKASDWDLLDKFGSSAPPLANYFDDPSVLLYDRRCELLINIDHVMSELNIERFPEHLRSNPYVARQLMLSAEVTTKKRVYRNYKTAVPQFYRDKGGVGIVQLLLPICLENPARADLALAIERIGNAYRGSTVLTLDMAYNNARLLARPDTEWLHP